MGCTGSTPTVVKYGCYSWPVPNRTMRVNELKREKLLAKYKYCYLESFSFFLRRF